MPKVPKYKHPLRRVRETLGWQQKELARRLDVSLPTIVAIENGQLRLSRALAVKIYFATGAIPASIDAPIRSDPRYSRRKVNAMVPLGADLKPLTAASAASVGKPEPGDPTAELSATFDARGFLDAMLQAAAKKRCFAPVFASFWEWLARIQEEYNLKATAAAVCAGYSPPSDRIRTFLPDLSPKAQRELIAHWESMEWYKVNGWPDDLANEWLLSEMEAVRSRLDDLRSPPSRAPKGGRTKRHR